MFMHSWRSWKKEKLRKRTKRSKLKQLLQQHRWVAQIVGMVGVAVVIIILVRFLGSITLFAPKYTITSLTYAPESVATYDNPLVYQAVHNAFSGKNYFMTKWFWKEELLQTTQQASPIVKSIRFNQQTGSTVFAHIEFHQPTLIFLIPPDRKVATYAGELYPLGTGDTLGAGAPIVNLPRYTSGFNNLYGILYKIPETTLLQRIQTIENTLWVTHIQDMTYLPGGEKLFVTYKGKQVYFHLTKDINAQLAKLVDLETYYSDFGNLEIIDLWSVDDIIVE